MYQIEIDHDHRRVLTTWGPVVTDEALGKYQDSIWSDDAIKGYDELIDFRALEKTLVTAEGLRNVAQLASQHDAERHGRYFAIVVRGDLAFGLSRMYETLRESQNQARRRLRIFEDDIEAALEWLDSGHRSPER